MDSTYGWSIISDDWMYFLNLMEKLKLYMFATWPPIGIFGQWIYGFHEISCNFGSGGRKCLCKQKQLKLMTFSCRHVDKLFRSDSIRKKIKVKLLWRQVSCCESMQLHYVI